MRRKVIIHFDALGLGGIAFEDFDATDGSPRTWWRDRSAGQTYLSQGSDSPISCFYVANQQTWHPM
jgi:hypothetical protein